MTEAEMNAIPMNPRGSLLVRLVRDVENTGTIDRRSRDWHAAPLFNAGTVLRLCAYRGNDATPTDKLERPPQQRFDYVSGATDKYNRAYGQISNVGSQRGVFAALLDACEPMPLTLGHVLDRAGELDSVHAKEILAYLLDTGMICLANVQRAAEIVGALDKDDPTDTPNLDALCARHGL